MHIKYATEGSLIIGLEVSVATFYRIGDLLGIIDELLSSLLQRYRNYGKGSSTLVTVSLDFKDIHNGSEIHEIYITFVSRKQ